MKKAFKSLTALSLVPTLLAVLVIPAFASNSVKKVDYVAFGDSLAAGYYIDAEGNPVTSSDYGYPNQIADHFHEIGVQADLTKLDEFCFSGMTAAQLAGNTAVLNTIGSTQWHLVRDAELATLDIGANDLLPVLREDLGILGGANDDAARQAAYLKLYGDVDATGAAVQASIETTLRNILNANKNVDIYVMGYYNPFTLMFASYYPGLAEQLNVPLATYNAHIQAAVDAVKAEYKGSTLVYVDTMGIIASDPAAYLTAVDIHPTIAGYGAIADAFWTAFEENGFHALQLQQTDEPA